MLCIVILATGFRQADAIASLIVVALMLRAAPGLLHQPPLPADPRPAPDLPRRALRRRALTFQLEPAGHAAHETGAHA
jgi:hypothetical protein